MATDPQNLWNRSTGKPDEWSVIIPPNDPPSCSWWICASREAFNLQWQKELPRITRSVMAKTIHPIILGGKLP